MKKGKRILAMIGVILLVLLYLSTLVFAILGKNFLNWLMAAIAATIMLPILIWLYELLAQKIQDKE